MPENREKRLLTYTGFAARSRKVAAGTEQVLNAVRKAPETVAVIAAGDVSERTRKQLRDKCTFYKAALFEVKATTEELARLIGKTSPVAAVAVTDKSLAKAIKALWEDGADGERGAERLP